MKETAAISLSTKNVFLNHDAYSCTTACKDKVLPQSILLLLIIDESCSVNYEVRLVNTIESDKSIEGSVQICYRNSWTPICSNTYYYYSSQKIGNVLCNSIEDSKIVTSCELQKKIAQVHLNFIVSKVYTDGRFGGPTADSITRISCRQSNNIRYCSLSQQYYGCTSFCSRPLGLKCYCKYYMYSFVSCILD